MFPDGILTSRLEATKSVPAIPTCESYLQYSLGDWKTVLHTL